MPLSGDHTVDVKEMKKVRFESSNGYDRQRSSGPFKLSMSLIPPRHGSIQPVKTTATNSNCGIQEHRNSVYESSVGPPPTTLGNHAGLNQKENIHKSFAPPKLSIQQVC